MSSAILQGGASGTGSVTVLAPNTNSNRTLTLPDSTGTLAAADGSGNLSVSGNLSFNSGYGSAATAYGCRAWVNFNGAGTVSIRASGNVSSITDSGTGYYTVNFTTALVDTSYAPVATANEPFGQTRVACTTNNATGSTVVYTFALNGVLSDVDVLSLAAFR